MAELVTIARPYAKAIFEYATAENAVIAWHKVIDELAKIIQDHNMQLFIDHPKTSIQDIVSCVLQVLGQNSGVKINDLENWLSVLVKNNRIKLAPYIASLFNEMQLKRDAKLNVNVITAKTLSDNTINNIKLSIAKMHTKAPQISTIENKELLGGIILETGDKVLDGSIRTRLKQLKQHMMSA
jgi:F-type H+-transporting ATPase subunit delta